MRFIATALLLILALSACTGPIADVEPIPGRISYERHERDADTCKRLNDYSDRTTGFLATAAAECDLALAQILDRRTELDIFDVSRAYLDALHDYANAIEFLKAQEEGGRVSSDYGAYLIGRQTGLIGAMQDWRSANGKMIHPISLAPKGIFV